MMIRLLFGLLLMLQVPASLAALCSSIWTPGERGDGLTELVGSPLNLPAFKGGASLTAKDPRDLPVGVSHWSGGTAANAWTLTAPTNGTAQVFVDGDLIIDSNNVALNASGTPDNLVLIIKGSLVIKNNVEIRGFVFATESIEFKNNATLRGAISAKGTVTGKNNTDAEFDAQALARTDFAGLCETGVAPGVNHFQMLFSTPQFSCEPIPVRIRACADASCATTVAVNRSLALAPAGRWLGEGTVTFAGNDTATAYLKRIPGALQLGVANEAYRCNNGYCGLEILQSGFAIQVPELVAGQEMTAEVQALRLASAGGACVADGSFASRERTIAFWSGYSAPASGEQAVQIAGDAIGRQAGAASARTLRFDAQARSRLPIRYDDAGVMELHARFQGSGDEEGLDMRGSVSFISRPYGFCIEAGTTVTGCNDADCPLFQAQGHTVRAGDPFRLRITPVGRPAGTELCTAAPTRNFTGPLALRAQVLQPADGLDARLETDQYHHPLGGRHEQEQKLHEVGIFAIEARSAGYMGGSDIISRSAPLGRFAPARLQARLNTPELQPGCVAGVERFSYQDQPIDFSITPELTITGLSRNGMTTANYDRGGFWKPKDSLVPGLGFAADQARDASRLSSAGIFQQAADDTPGDGAKTFRYTADQIFYQRDANGPSASDVPFEPRLLFSLDAGQLRDRDGTCYGAAHCTDFDSAEFGFTMPGGEIRLGRLHLANAHGSELEPLALQYRVETWRAGTAFVPDESDSCSALGAVRLEHFTGGLQGRTQAQVTPLDRGVGAIILSAPGAKAEGSVRVTPDVPAWLTFDWNGDGVREEPNGLATFGIYKGFRPLIFRRELIGR